MAYRVEKCDTFKVGHICVWRPDPSRPTNNIMMPVKLAPKYGTAQEQDSFAFIRIQGDCYMSDGLFGGEVLKVPPRFLILDISDRYYKYMESYGTRETYLSRVVKTLFMPTETICWMSLVQAVRFLDILECK